MTYPSSPPTAVHPSSVLGAYCEAFVAGKRVAILGEGAPGLSEQIAEASGRRVHVFATDAAWVAARIAELGDGRESSIRHVLLETDAELRQASFDVVVVSDLLAPPGPTAWMAHARALVVGHGLVVVAMRNPKAVHDLGDDPPTVRRDPRLSSAPRGAGAVPAASAVPVGPAAAADSAAEPEGLGYYELYDLMSEHFAEVRMVGQAPFVGFTLADFSAGAEPSVTIDTSLMGSSEEPTWFIAVGSERPLRVDPYVLIQVPLAAAHGWLEPAEPQVEPSETALLTVAAERERALLAELSDTQQRLHRESELAESRRQAAAATSTRVAELEVELSASNTRLAELTERCEQLEQAGEVGASREIEQLRDTAAHAEARVAELEEQVRAGQSREAALRRELGERERPRRAGGDREAAIRREFAERESKMRRAIEDLEGREHDLEVALTESMDREADLETELEGLRERLVAQKARAASSPDASRPAEESGSADRARAAAPERADSSRGDQIRALQFQLDELRKALDASRGDREKLQRELADERASLEELRAARSTIRELEAALSATHAVPDGGDGAAPDEEVDRLEQRLRERGRYVAELEARLREAQRVGRELLQELALRGEAPGASQPSAGPAAAEAATEPEPAVPAEPERSSGPSEPAPEPEPWGAQRGEIEGLRQQVELLGQRCSAHEADLEAARWTIASLRHDLEHAAESEHTSDQRKLEDALRVAQQELSLLRTRLREAAPDGSDAAE